MTFGSADSETAAEELDRAHQEFLAEIVHLDGKTAQRLFQAIPTMPDDATTSAGADGQKSESVS